MMKEILVGIGVGVLFFSGILGLYNWLFQSRIKNFATNFPVTIPSYIQTLLKLNIILPLVGIGIASIFLMSMILL